VSLHDQHIDAANRILVKQKVVVTVYGNRAELLILSCEQNLIIVTIHNQTICNTFLHVVRTIVTIDYQVFSLLQLRLLLRSMLHLRLWKVLLHVLKHLLHILKSLHTERKSLSTLHFNLRIII
jgi:hypothetical protein